jgi:very-short-patch-repair endonuclease
MPRTDETLKARARTMRSEQTPAEAKLWSLLRAHRFSSIKFTRQVIVAPYILDFAARSRKIAIELDGDTHAHRLQYDAARTAYLESKGYRVIRFTNADIMGNIEGVATIIGDALDEASRATCTSAPLPGPLPRGERE